MGMGGGSFWMEGQAGLKSPKQMRMDRDNFQVEGQTGLRVQNRWGQVERQRSGEYLQNSGLQSYRDKFQGSGWT